MNEVILTGRLTDEPQYKTAASGKGMATYKLAVDRAGNHQDSEQTSGFFDCVVFDKGADFAQTYLHKGTKINVVGSLRQRSYVGREDGKRKYSVEIVVGRQEFAESKTEPAPATRQPQAEIKRAPEGFLDIPLDALNDEGLPFK